jgi:hypothetical protein
LYLLRLSFLINGYHNSPIITGITPTYVPIRAKFDACFNVGWGVSVANCTVFQIGSHHQL